MSKILIIHPGHRPYITDIHRANIILTAVTEHTNGETPKEYTHYNLTKNRYGPCNVLIPRHRIDSLNLELAIEMLELFNGIQ